MWAAFFVSTGCAIFRQGAQVLALKQAMGAACAVCSHRRIHEIEGAAGLARFLLEHPWIQGGAARADAAAAGPPPAKGLVSEAPCRRRVVVFRRIEGRLPAGSL